VEHVAIDLGGRESQVCIRNGTGGIVLEERVSTAKLRRFLDRPKARVILETCSETFGAADLALEYGHDVRVVPASLVKSLGVGAGERRRTDGTRRC
jgi:transposase